jgi:hypothetical protein
MKRIIISLDRVVALIVPLVCVAGFGAGSALAQSPHFINSKTKATLESDGDLAVSFKEAGLGDTETSYSLDATAAVTCTCVNRSGTCPAAANKASFSEDLGADGTFDPKNGTVSATLTITAPECPDSSPPTCGNGQEFRLSQIAYTGVTLFDTTNGIQAALQTEFGPVTFFTCP